MSLRVFEAKGRRGSAAFVDVPFRLYGAGSGWIPPLRMTTRDQLDMKGNPFYRDAERALFIAEREGSPVGRIAAIENRWHNRHHADRVGFFGFFECADDPEAASALFEQAESWLRGRGLDASRGPVSPSMNHECGLLVEGFEHPPVMMTPWSPPYLGGLVEKAGYGKAQDLFGYYLSAAEVPERIERLAERTKRKTGITFRSLDPSILKQEARRILELYCEAWADNWGFVPPSWDEFWHSAKELKLVLAPRYSFVAEVGDQVVGFWMVTKDVNDVLRGIPDGRLWPWNVARLLSGLRHVEGHRLVLLGLTDEYRGRGLMSLFAYEAARRAQAAGARGAEASWVLESNDALNGPLASLGYDPYKRWRIYEKAL